MNGYIPHPGQLSFKCGNCGCSRFKSYPQTVPTDGREWTYEYECVECGQIMGLTIVSKEDEE